jgi:hypothetical protein
MQGTAPFTEEKNEEVGESGMKLDVGVIHKKVGPGSISNFRSQISNLKHLEKRILPVWNGASGSGSAPEGLLPRRESPLARRDCGMRN